jgi:predicted AlkP superfamily pyrophosphatase or phosphodiesterase
MHKRNAWTAIFLLLVLALPAWASVHNARPKLVVVIVVDQFRGDYLERYRDRFGADGFRLLMDKGAWFTECYYDYANLQTAPGHATLGTGSYTNGHGIIGNDWYDPAREGLFSSVADRDVRVVGNDRQGASASPRNLLASTFGDEVKFATQGQAKVFGVAFKDRSAILPVGRSADGAFWIDRTTGEFVSSTYFYPDGRAPGWLQRFNGEKRAEKYLDLEFKDAGGKVFRTTQRVQKDSDGSPLNYYDIVGRTPFANAYILEMAQEIITSEQLGQHQVTDVLTISLSGYDILAHKVGPDSPELVAETLALDRQLADFFGFLGRQIGLANVWIALSADHGAAPMAETAQHVLRTMLPRFDITQITKQMNAEFARRYPGASDKEFIKAVYWPKVYLSEKAFAAVGVRENEAERAAGEMLVGFHRQALAEAKVKSAPETMFRGIVTRTQLEAGMPNAAADDWARQYVHSYSSLPGWYVFVIPPPYLGYFSAIKDRLDAEHGVPYSYDAHVPLLLFGLPFQPGQFRTHVEPVDLAVTLTSLLGTNKPTRAVGRVLTEAIR